MYWCKDRHIDQWNRTERPEINPPIYGQMIFDKPAEIFPMGKAQCFQEAVLGKCDIHMQQDEVGPLF